MNRFIMIEPGGDITRLMMKRAFSILRLTKASAFVAISVPRFVP